MSMLASTQVLTETPPPRRGKVVVHPVKHCYYVANGLRI